MDRARREVILGFLATAVGASAARDSSAQQVIGSQKEQYEPSEKIKADASEIPEQIAKFRVAKERILDETIEVTRTALDQDPVREALEWQGEFPQSALFRAIEIPILPAHLDDTKYDVSDLRRRYPVQLGVMGALPDGNHKHVASPGIIPSIDKGPDALFKKKAYRLDSYGNCFYWNAPGVIVTTEHIAEMFPASLKSLRMDGLDISVANLPPRFASRSPEQIIHDDPSVSDAEIHGSLVCIVGRDPDQLSDMDGAKVYPGIAVKMTPEFIHGALSEISQASRRNMAPQEYEQFIQKIRIRMNNSYLMILPPGEARAYPNIDSQFPCQGMSASPAFGFIRGSYRLVGIFFSSMCLTDAQRRRTVDVAFFHPISAIRKLAAEPKGYWTIN